MRTVDLFLLGMVEVEKLGIILEPTAHEFERRAVLNPACYREGNFVHMFYRAVDEKGRSSIGYAKLEGPTTVVERWQKPILVREYDYESVGLEDPRIVKIGNTFYMTYVAHDGVNAITAYATGRDIKKLKKQGIISPQITYGEVSKIFEETHLKDAYYLFASFYEKEGGGKNLIWHKDAFFFPKKIGKKFAMIHRILPDIHIVFFNNFAELSVDFWRNYFSHLADYVILENKHWFETRHIGGGAPPIETKDGWVLIFHGVEETNEKRVYHVGAALLDLKEPRKVIGKLHEPLFSPTEEWETSRPGLEVPNVVFPTGTAIFGDTLYIYYGAADTRIAVASVSLPALIEELKNPSPRHHSYHGEQNYEEKIAIE